MSSPKIGAHVSAGGGVHNAIPNAQKIGAGCFQIFGASPRTWQAPLPKPADLDKYHSLLKESALGPVYLHAAYLVNLASPNPEVVSKSIQSLSSHLEICSLLKADGLIFHIGSGKGTEKSKSISQIVSGIKEVFKNVSNRSAHLLLENDAGEGGKVGSRFEDIGAIIKKVNSSRLGVCFDTAHGFAAGLVESYTPVSVTKLFSDFDQYIGLKNLKVIHANDSKTKSGSNSDRHENIGEGHIGKNGFAALAGDKRLRHLPWILEVPGFSGNGPDKKNIDILKKISDTV